MELKNAQIRKLKGLAQRLDPVLRVGKAGVSEGLLQSVDLALKRHELIKVRFEHFKDEKATLAPFLAEKTGSYLVTRVGHVVVLYRQNPDEAQRQVVL